MNNPFTNLLSGQSVSGGDDFTPKRAKRECPCDECRAAREREAKSKKHKMKTDSGTYQPNVKFTIC